MWLFVLLGVAFLGIGLAGARGALPPAVGLLSVAGFFFCLLCAVLFGYQSRKAALADRSRNAATSMLVMMAAMLKEENDETLERIAAKGGPGGDAAKMLLQRRRGH
jgi:hypothetical protein